MKKQILSVILALALLLSCSGCSLEESYVSSVTTATASTAADGGGADETWAIYWYICGSDLESESGCATDDIIELQNVDLPSNVSVVLEAGGTSEWMNDVMQADHLGRYLYDSNGLQELEQAENANMGDPDTLSDFITYCTTNFDATHKLLIFWDHGGGSVGGVAFDENYDYDSLTLSEISSALEKSVSEKMFDIIGFDTCLMATLDTATVAAPYADYLIASEESEPGCGWYYTGWVDALANNTGISAAELGTVICDTFMEGCQAYDAADSATLSVIDLSKIGDVKSSVDAYGISLLSAASNDAGTLSAFAREAYSVTNYGGNSRASGYTNMVDLGDLAEESGDLAGDSATQVQSSIADAVVYQVCGSTEQASTGISIYYPLDNDESGVSDYDEVAASDLYECLLEYLLTGVLPEDTQELVAQAEAEQTAGAAAEGETEAGAAEAPEAPEASEPEINYDSAPVITPYNGEYWLDLSEDGYLTMYIDPEQLDSVASVTFGLMYFYDDYSDDLLELGWDDDLTADWENGTFTDNFRGVWGSLNGCICYMELMSEGDDCNTYCVPVTINGEDYYLLVAWYYDSGEFEILGARREIDAETGMADKDLYQPVAGDEVIPILYTWGDNGEEAVYIDTITVGSDGLTFAETDLYIGEYVYCFCVEDLQGNETYTEYANFCVEEDGSITVYLDY